MLVQVEADLNSSNKGEGRIDTSILEDYQRLHRPYRVKLLSVIEAVEASCVQERAALRRRADGWVLCPLRAMRSKQNFGCVPLPIPGKACNGRSRD